MLSKLQSYASALEDFNNARARAAFEDVLARLTGRSSELLSYDEVAEKLKLNVRTEAGIQDIPLKAIVGSVGRYTEFTRSFRPRNPGDRARWAQVKTYMDAPEGAGMEPIEVYKVGEVYFVLDGNHRVSIARQEGAEFIQAHVIEVKTDVPLTPDITPDDLIIKAEYSQFLEETCIADLRPGVDLSVSVPGQYEKLKEHIQVHRYFMGLDFKRDISYEEAVGHWYDAVYMEVVGPLRERGLLRWFPGRTETDMYLWLSEYRAQLQDRLGWEIKPEAALTELAAHESPSDNLTDTGSFRAMKMYDRYLDRLFGEILVPITGTQKSWCALEQALIIAEKEQSILHGLHVLPPHGRETRTAKKVLQRFQERTQEAGFPAKMALEKGSISTLVCERALLADLVVLHLAHPPLPGLSGLRSGMRSIIWRCARPVLTVPGNPSPLDNALLAYDGSQKAREALFVAAYLAEKWGTKLTVLTLEDGVSPKVQEDARTYLELHEVKADYVARKGSFDIFLKIIKERKINLVVMGGYSGNELKELFLGSAVNFLMRRANCPLLVCR